MAVVLKSSLTVVIEKHLASMEGLLTAGSLEPLPAKAGQWRAALAAPRPDKTLRWYFWANSPTREQIDFEQARLAGLFGRSRNRQMRIERERFDREVERKRRERQEQERFDRQYQERRQQQIEQAKAEQELERQARKDDWPVPRRKSHSELVKEGIKERKSKPKIAPSYHGPGYYEPAAGPSAVECFSLPREVAASLDLGRSDLDLLCDIPLTRVTGFVSSPHSRRRAWFSRWGRSFAPVTLAG